MKTTATPFPVGSASEAAHGALAPPVENHLEELAERLRGAPRRTARSQGASPKHLSSLARHDGSLGELLN